MLRFRLAAMIAAVALTGCRREKEQPQSAPPGMAGMTMQSDSLIPPMQAHLDSLAAMPGQSSAEMLAGHEAMAAKLLDAMGSDMTMMGMRPDSAWTALTDSVKRDLAELAALSGAAPGAQVLAHIERMKRLLHMHGQMMGGGERPK